MQSDKAPVDVIVDSERSPVPEIEKPLTPPDGGRGWLVVFGSFLVKTAPFEFDWDRVLTAFIFLCRGCFPCNFFFFLR